MANRIEGNKKLNWKKEEAEEEVEKCEVSPRQNQYLKNNTQASQQRAQEEDRKVEQRERAKTQRMKKGKKIAKAKFLRV